MTEKLIKGYIVVSVVEPVRDALEQGRIDQDQVDAILGDGAALLDEKIDPFRWYPVEVLRGFYRLIARAKGGDERSAMHELGGEQFEQLAALGVHQQLSFEEGAMREASQREVESWGRLVSTMLRSVYNFSEMSFGADPEASDCYHLDWRGIGSQDDVILEVTLGFVRALAQRSMGPGAQVTLDRLSPDHARYVVRRR
jgi:hypothetical protein